jgi:hypothetical protein
MRYLHIQELLEKDQCLKIRLGRRDQIIERRGGGGDAIEVSKEAILVTDAIHFCGLDAQKAHRREIFNIAVRVLVQKDSALLKSIKGQPAVAAVPVPPATKPAPKPPAPPPITQSQTQTPQARGRGRPRKNPKPETTTKQTKETYKVPDELPISELPPEKQPLELSDDYNPIKYPHYSVQGSIYSLLLTALSLGLHYEKYAGSAERHKKVESIMHEYQVTCDQIKP